MNIQLLFPSDCIRPSKVAPEYEDEYLFASRAGVACTLIDIDTMRLYGNPSVGTEIVYRGWMLNSDQYKAMSHSVTACGAQLMADHRDYINCHHLPRWYEKCHDLTPETMLFTEDQFDLIPTCLRDHGWRACFVKDYVKSLTTSRGSKAESLHEVYEIISQLRQFRGELEGGICLREFENLKSETERRYFVYQGRAFSVDDNIPSIMDTIIGRIDSPFYSVDLALNAEGDYRLIEIGDGQVSDRKEWSIEKFMQIFDYIDETDV